jgi:hypothetical protein
MIILKASLVLSIFGCTLFAATRGFSAAEPKPSPAKSSGTSWADLEVDKRCEGLLSFVRTAGIESIPDWILEKPECLIEGSSGGEITWSLDTKWRFGTKVLPLRFAIISSNMSKFHAEWCIIRGSKTGCTSVWNNSFDKGNLYKSREEARAAFDGVSKISTGFLKIATKVDEWVGREGTTRKIFGFPYNTWTKAWVSAPRSVPTPDGPASASYELVSGSEFSGRLKFATEVPAALRECLGCEDKQCTHGQLTFAFSDLLFTVEHEISEPQQKKMGVKVGSATWVMVSPTPFTSAVPNWAMLCGNHRFNIQKF